MQIGSADQQPAAATTHNGRKLRKLQETELHMPNYTAQPRPQMFTRNCVQSLVTGVDMAGGQAAEWAIDFATSWYTGSDKNVADVCSYGNWCGGGCSGLNGPPIDEVDAICKVHDECYSATDRCSICKCDAELIASLQLVLAKKKDCGCLNIFCWEDANIEVASQMSALFTGKRSFNKCSDCPPEALSQEDQAAVDAAVTELADLLAATVDNLSDSVASLFNITWADVLAPEAGGSPSPSPSSFLESPSPSSSLESPSPSPDSPSPSPESSPDASGSDNASEDGSTDNGGNAGEGGNADEGGSTADDAIDDEGGTEGSAADEGGSTADDAVADGDDEGGFTADDSAVDSGTTSADDAAELVSTGTTEEAP